MAKHKHKKGRPVVVDDPATWVKYRKGLCRDCVANCCTMPVEATLSDLVRLGVVDPFDIDQPVKNVAKSLKKARIIDHFSSKHEKFTLARRANGDCLYLDFTTRRCTVYANRPTVCREHPRVGPRPNHCAYEPKNS